MKTPLTLLALLALAAIAHAASIWIEGEVPAQSTAKKHPWYDSVKRDLLSGERWLSHYGDEAGEATYAVEVKEAGTYVLWARLNPVASQPRWRLDDGPWAPVDSKEARQQQNISGDGKIDHRFIAWVKIATLPLKTGQHQIAFRFEGGASNSGGLDCFVLTSDGFVPQGTTKPGAIRASGVDEWFPLLADEDPLDARSVIDMSRLIPAPAGQFGFLKATGDKLQFEKASAPQKFWGVGANLEAGKYSREQLIQRARYLRKFGINTVRQHTVFDEVTKDGVLNAKRLDEYDWWFAELKKHGIYTAWSVFYHFTIGPDDGYPPELYAELKAEGGRANTYGLITVSPKLWEIRNRWLVQMLQHKNPYTGLRYVDDPALITVEMQNEDSVFFWNPLGGLAEGKRWPQHSKLLRTRFAAWVKAKYKTNDALKAAWGELQRGDRVDASELAIMSPWELDGPGPRGTFAGQPRRAGDFIQCLAEMQRGFYEDCARAIRSAGFKGVVITTAWQVGGAASDAANLWTDTVGDMIDRHNYAGGGAGGHSITEGKVSAESHLTQPGGGIFSMGMKQVAGKPFCLTEWTQSPPNPWKTECAPIFAFYGMGLQGWDASWHFAQSGTRLGDGWPGMSSYVTDTPAYIGQFPALALALHRGDLREGDEAARRQVDRAALFGGIDPLKQDATQGGYDAKTLVVSGGTPLEFLGVGRVLVDFSEAAAKPAGIDPLSFWNRDTRILRSTTNELAWDYGRERILVTAPRTQAIVGRPGSEPIALPAVTATIKTPFVSLLFTALDDAPLADSKRILITALARDRQTGARYSADNKTLEAAGTPPLLLEPVVATLKFATRPAKVTPCDHYGVPAATSVPIHSDGSFQIDGTHQAYYYELQR